MDNKLVIINDDLLKNQIQKIQINDINKKMYNELLQNKIKIKKIKTNDIEKEISQVINNISLTKKCNGSFEFINNEITSLGNVGTPGYSIRNHLYDTPNIKINKFKNLIEKFINKFKNITFKRKIKVKVEEADKNISNSSTKTDLEKLMDIDLLYCENNQLKNNIKKFINIIKNHDNNLFINDVIKLNNIANGIIEFNNQIKETVNINLETKKSINSLYDIVNEQLLLVIDNINKGINADIIKKINVQKKYINM